MEISTACDNMLKQQIRPVGVENENILQLMASIPRELFMPERLRGVAYAEMAIPLPHHENGLPPSIMARLLQAVAVQKTDKILLIGVDCGYLAALLASLAQQVNVVDNNVDLLQHAAKATAKLGLEHLKFHLGNLEYGWSGEAPYDVIIIAGSIPSLPPELLKKLTPNGRIFAMIGRSPVMEAVLIKSASQGSWQAEFLFETDVPRLSSVSEPSKFIF